MASGKVRDVTEPNALSVYLIGLYCVGAVLIVTVSSEPRGLSQSRFTFPLTNYMNLQEKSKQGATKQARGQLDLTQTCFSVFGHCILLYGCLHTRYSFKLYKFR